MDEQHVNVRIFLVSRQRSAKFSKVQQSLGCSFIFLLMHEDIYARRLPLVATAAGFGAE